MIREHSFYILKDGERERIVFVTCTKGGNSPTGVCGQIEGDESVSGFTMEFLQRLQPLGLNTDWRCTYTVKDGFKSVIEAARKEHDEVEFWHELRKI